MSQLYRRIISLQGLKFRYDHMNIRSLYSMHLSGELGEAPSGHGLLEDFPGGESGRESAAGGQHCDRDVVRGRLTRG